MPTKKCIYLSIFFYFFIILHSWLCVTKKRIPLFVGHGERLGWALGLCVFLVCVFRYFFFSCMWTVTSHGFIVQGTKITVHTLFITVHTWKNIKNGSHDTIHTFKNYFATVFSVFSFQFSVSATISSIQMDPWFQLLHK